jgi:hypothetical protein
MDYETMTCEEEILTQMTILGCKAIDGHYTKEGYCKGTDGDYRFDSIHGVNFKPHPFTIGTQLVAHASDNFMGRLGAEAIEDYEKKHGSACAYRARPGAERCNVPYDEHTSDRVAFLKVRTEKTLKENKELPKFLYACKPTLEKEKIDGIGFVKWD